MNMEKTWYEGEKLLGYDDSGVLYEYDYETETWYDTGACNE